MATDPVLPADLPVNLPAECVIDVDLVDVWAEPGRKTLLRTLVWGDRVKLVGHDATRLQIETTVYRLQADGSELPEPALGYLEPTRGSGLAPASLLRPWADNRVLKVHFVDVQQGDGAVIEAPDGRLILVDGGDNQLFARYLASLYPGTTADQPRVVDCILVTHGDADHFSGLPLILASETNRSRRKRFFMQPRRVFHNGLVKRPDKLASGKARAERDMLGPTRSTPEGVFATSLVASLLSVPDTQMNEPFRRWKQALATYHARASVEFRRLERGDDQDFGFFNQGDLRIDVLGPQTTRIAGRAALPLLGRPPQGPRIGHESVATDTAGFGGVSAAHTINGHSVVFRLVYGGFSYLFAGDLNDQASRTLAQAHARGELNLRSAVFKTPHHGSADFSGAFIQAVAPLVSVVSSGDENERKEYIHPRATLMGALGRWSRSNEPLVLVTELAAFFRTEGWARLTDSAKAARRGDFFGFSRTVYGLVKTRTDGQRLLVSTDSGNLALKEAYAYTLDGAGEPQPSPVVRA